MKEDNFKESLIRANKMHHKLGHEYKNKTVMQFHHAEGGREKWKRIYGKIDDYYNETLIKIQNCVNEFEYLNDIEKAMKENWKNIISKIKSQVYEVADHVQVWKKCFI